MRIEAVKTSTAQGLVTTIRKTAYCSIHGPANRNGNHSNGLYSSGDEDSRLESKRIEKKTKKKARRTLPDKGNMIPLVAIPTIPVERLTAIAEAFSFPRRNEFLMRLYAYWKLKRQSRNGAPLLRRLQNSNPIMRIDLNKEKMKRETNKIRTHLTKLQKIRCDLERVRLLMELIKKRENLKLKLIKESRAISILQLNPFRVFLLHILERVVEKDVNQFFIHPVSIEDAPDYFTHITNPMDLGTMRKLVEGNRYRSFAEFENDLNLIIDNCLFYNDKDTIYYKAALKLKVVIDNLLKEYRPRASIYNQSVGLHLQKDSQPPPMFTVVNDPSVSTGENI